MTVMIVKAKCPNNRRLLAASGGISVQVGLSMYILAPSCHAGDYDEEGEAWWVVLHASVSLLPVSGATVQNRAALDTEEQRVVGMLPASRVRLELNRRALRAACL